MSRFIEKHPGLPPTIEKFKQDKKRFKKRMLKTILLLNMIYSATLGRLPKLVRYPLITVMAIALAPPTIFISVFAFFFAPFIIALGVLLLLLKYACIWLGHTFPYHQQYQDQFYKDRGYTHRVEGHHLGNRGCHGRYQKSYYKKTKL